MNKSRIIVLFGGKADEHSISCISAASVLRAMDTEQFEPIPVAITRQGAWILPHDDPRQYSLDDETLPVIDSRDDDENVILDMAGGRQGFFVRKTDGNLESLGHIDAVFPVLHGPYGEDGTIQGLCETMGVPYVGCQVLSSAVCLDKHFCKLILRDNQLPVAPWVSVTLPDIVTDISDDYCLQIEEIIAQKNLISPLFVKPSRAGSSFGVVCVKEEQGTQDFHNSLREALAEARQHDNRILIEQGIQGREFECAIVQLTPHGDPQVSAPGEIILAHKNEGDEQFYDFDTKYRNSEASRVQIPAHARPDVLRKVQFTALAAFRAVDARGLSRVDCFVTPDNEVIINEINTMPGFTPISLYARALEYEGYSYSELITCLINSAVRGSHQ